MSDKFDIVCAAYLLLLSDGRILLSKRLNTGYQDGKYSLVAGHVEFGETPTQCIIREAAEEAGILLKEKDLSVVHTMWRDYRTTTDSNRLDIFFIATNWDGNVVNNEPGKCSDLSWFDPDHFPKNTAVYVSQAFKLIEAGIFYSEYKAD